VLDQRLLASLTEAGDVVQRARPEALGALGALVGDREAVGLVADALQQVEALAGAREDHRVGFGGQPHLLQPFRQPADRDVGDAQFGEHVGCGLHLRLAPVDDQ
jgi:hypothetical protein